MTCSFCNKSAFKQYYLCDCCSLNLERYNATTNDLLHTQEKSVTDIPLNEEICVGRIEDDSCPEKFQQNEFLQHQGMISVFRCCVCDQDYVSKEGLFNHLNLHKVHDDNKPKECREVRIAHNLRECSLCNDQRGYQEKLYWEHVHEDHDGFFLLCSGCGECFRSQKHLTDHGRNSCISREQLSVSNGTTISLEHLKDRKSPNGIKQATTILSSSNDHSELNTHQEQGDDVDMTQGSYEFVAIKEEISLEDTLLEDENNGDADEQEEDSCRQIVSEADPMQSIIGSHDDSSLLHFPTPIRAIAHEMNRPHHAHEDVSKCDSFDGWKTCCTVPLQKIVSLVLSIEFGFRFKSQNVSSRGKMRYYDCRRIKHRVVPQCDRKLLVFVPNTDADATVCLKGKHTCGDAPPERLSRAKPHKKDYKVIPNLVESEVPFSDQFNDHMGESTYESTETDQPGSWFCSPSHAAINDTKPSYVNEDFPKANFFEGWDVHNTVPVQDIDSHVMSIEFGFRFKSQNLTYKAKMRYYDCRRIKHHVVPQCERKLLVSIPNNDAVATICLRGKHTCENASHNDLARPRLSETENALIIDLVRSGIAPKEVIRRFKLINTEISEYQLRYAVQAARNRLRNSK